MCSWRAEGLEVGPGPVAARALAAALPLQDVQGGRCQAARAPGFVQWEPREQGRAVLVVDVMGLEPAPNLEAVGSPPPRALHVQGMMRPPGKCAALGLVPVREGSLAQCPWKLWDCQVLWPLQV